MVQPVTRVAMARYGTHGPSLQVAMFTQDATPPEAEVVAVCDRDRAHL
ncbi:MAG: hypothetical protein L0Y54_23095 [Sporichthyaceae bacterium]|nr:hypothetical protein [Sporichthyaceae bacterium]